MANIILSTTFKENVLKRLDPALNPDSDLAGGFPIGFFGIILLERYSDGGTIDTREYVPTDPLDNGFKAVDWTLTAEPSLLQTDELVFNVEEDITIAGFALVFNKNGGDNEGDATLGAIYEIANIESFPDGGTFSISATEIKVV